ncbi:MAG: hypothetical protein FD123_47 [Bacteroidetes bacterium]|nr:MAG: hypothetical protein FD123_47 [Bacteroidota bacterium]
MKKIVVLLSVTIFSFQLSAQTTADAPRPNMSRQEIGKTGYSAMMPDGMPMNGPVITPDSSQRFTGTKDVGGGFTFGFIAVKFQEFDNSTPDELEDLLVTYLDSVQKSWNIVKTNGYGGGKTLASDSKARGVIDYWSDKDGKEYALKGWANKTGLCVLYIQGPNIYPHTTIADSFFDQFRFK